jgi:hypothetical protein
LSSLLQNQHRNDVSKRDCNSRVRLKTEMRCFLTVDDVDLMDDTSDIAYDGGAVYVVVGVVDERPLEALLRDMVEDIARVSDVRLPDVILLRLIYDPVSVMAARILSSS